MPRIKCTVKILIVLFTSLIVIFKLNQFSQQSKDFFIQKNKIIKELDQIKHSELQLNYVVSASGLYLYKNNDSIIKAIKNLQNDINHLLQNNYFKTEYYPIYKDIQTYNTFITNKINTVYEFQSYNSAIKNSTMYLALLLQQFSLEKTHKPPIYKKKLIQTISTVFLTKNSMDKELIHNIDIHYFSTVDLHNEALNRLNKMFTAHLKIFQKYYPNYNTLLHKILNKKTEHILNQADNNIYKLSVQKLENIKYTLYFLIGFILLFTLIVIALIIKSEKENGALNLLTNKLQENIRVDNLTQLYNRFKYDEDVQHNTYYGFYLINIDKFKYINDYYGTKIGDKVLQKVARILQDIVLESSHNFLYRLGADDFGILVKNSSNIQNTILEYFEKNDINVGEFQFKISVSIAYTQEKPYFEHANITLKKIKSSSRIKYLQYSKEIDNKQQILQNIEKTKILYNALKHEKVVPFFQGIVDVKTQQITKYEVLSRVLKDDGSIESIFPYLQIAKDNKLYSNITKSVLNKSIQLFNENNIPFNINFSIEDITDKSILEILYTIIKTNPRIMKNITFEILESESIHDYNAIKHFIEEMKQVGAKIAIDDFGSGYSNFEHLLNLDIDFIKIDGSLIKNIHTDKNAYNIVQLINTFAHQSNIKTVAEFVENEAIYTVIKEIGIDYAQGYYFAKPESTIIFS